MFSPSESLKEKLVTESAKIVGFPIFDVSWSPDRECLCIYELDKRGNQTVRKELRSDPIDPDRKRTFEYEVEHPIADDTGRIIGVTVEERSVDSPLDPEDEGYEEIILGSPRQITDADVQEALESAKYKERMSKEILERMKKQKERIDANKAEHRANYIEEAAKDMVQIFQAAKSGKNPFIDLGAHSDEQVSPLGGFTVTDSRRVK